MPHFIYLSSIFITISLAFVLLLKNYKSPINISFSAFLLSISSWVGTLYLLYYFNFGHPLLIGRLNFAFTELVAFSAFWFGYYFPEKIFTIKKRYTVSLTIFTIFLFFITAFTDLIDKNEIVTNGKIETVFGVLYPLFVVYFITLFLFVVGFILYKYKRVRSLKRQQIKVLLAGVVIGVSTGVVTNIFLPLFFGFFELQHIAPLVALFFCSVVFYAIISYRLMDIRIVARKIFIYAIIAIFTYGGFYFLIWFDNEIFGSAFSKSAYIAGLFVAPIFVACFLGLMKLLKIFANKYLFYSLYNYQEAINKLSQELNYYTDLNKIINVIVNSVKKTMQLDRAGVLLVNQEDETIHYKIAKVIGFNKSNGISLVKDNFLTKYLEKTQHLLVREELEILAKEASSQKDKKSFLKLYDHMKKIEASVCLPLMKGKNLIGIIVLGSKISGDAYTKEDLELLDTLANQAGIAIDNARLYKEVQDFTKTLQQKVDEQTQDLQATNKKLNETIKELNVKNNLNKELLEMKSDFLRVVNHQLNTPLSVMRGYFSMMKEGSYKPKQAMPSIEKGLMRINQTVEDFWDAYELEGERMKMEPQKVDIIDVVDKLIEEKKNIPLAKERKLSLSVKKPDFKIPIVWCDYKKIAHVISNLLDNAVFYTYKGKVEVSYELVNGEYLKINVQDTGSGITKEERKKLFQKFSRGSKATGMHPDGSGLGLYIARKIVEGNGGELTVFSEGKDKGSTFSFTLPIYKNQKASKEEIITRDKKMEMF